MKTLALISLLTALSATQLAQAQTESASDTVTISAREPKIELPGKFYRMLPEEFKYYKQAYSLSNGKTLSLFSRGRSMFAEINGQPAHEIAAITSNSFIALDQKLKMTIQLLDNDEVRGELLMLVPSEQVAGQAGAGEKMVVVGLH
ncbi:hypothetical protein [Undibacterium terreum]|uniref:Uncharacterized protein n=1 Tax=Undibacterium terreum TaxID=1224302 RepID=A0A916UIA8_9BURK|nr:hypothetical protein [Undibacterium terreum]GGC72963.1 hypothetical protein GCM10011396_20170 [Undibacterium terreum]